MRTRFDLEQQILECWNVTKDLRHVTEYMLDAPLEPGREDKIANMLLGMEALYEVKFQKCFNTFETMLKEIKENNKNNDIPAE
jgi:cytochrome c-type biogenesis protein CcmH/NrfG